MEDFLALILEVFAEVLIELCGELLISLSARAIGKFFMAIFEPGPLWAVVGVVLLGLASGACSLAVFPHPLVHPSTVHGISLIVSPAITGVVMSQVGRLLRNRGTRTIWLESFAYGFTFAFALTVVRLLFVK